MTLPGLDAPARTRWTGSREVVPYDGDRHCRRCSYGVVVRVGTFTQHALFIHAGYGAGEATDVDLCLSCGAVNRGRVATVRPPRTNGKRAAHPPVGR